jgi:hypothetical protein
LAHWDNPKADRYSVELEIISVEVNGDCSTLAAELRFPLIEILQAQRSSTRKPAERIEGIVGNNFSSYVRDYDFSVLLAEHKRNQPNFSTPQGFRRPAWQSCSSTSCDSKREYTGKIRQAARHLHQRLEQQTYHRTDEPPSRSWVSNTAE